MGVNRRSCLIIVVIFLLGLCLSQAAFADDVEDKRQKLWDITKKLRLKRQQLEKVKKQQGLTLRNLAIINKRLKSTQHELTYAESQLKYKEGQIRQTKDELSMLKESYIIQKNLFKKRIRDIYKENRFGYLILLFTSKTMGDFLNRTLYLEKVLQADVKLLERLSAQEKQIRQKEQILSKRYSEISEIKNMFQQRKGIFKKQQVSQNKVYSNIARKRKAYERQIAELEKNSKEIENMIVKLMKEGKVSSVKGSGNFAWPVRGQLTSHYGYRRHPIFKKVRFHSGLDIGARTGTRINAADAGQVIFAGWWGGYGRAVIVDHGNGYSTVYGHMSKIFVKKGQYVRKGQSLGAVGSTGYATGPHLHFEIRKRGKTMNPLRFLKSK